MFGYINKRKALELVEDDVKFYWKLYERYVDRIDCATDEVDTTLWQEMAADYFSKYQEASRILHLLKAL